MNNYPYYTKRYQHQPWYIRLLRRARYQPAAIVEFNLWLFCWIIKGLPAREWIPCGDNVYCSGFSSREKTYLHARRVILDRWKMKAGWFETTHEVTKRAWEQVNANQN